MFRLGCAHFNKLSSLNTFVEVSLSGVTEVVCQLPSFTRLFKVTFEEILTWLSVMTRLKERHIVMIDVLFNLIYRRAQILDLWLQALFLVTFLALSSRSRLLAVFSFISLIPGPNFVDSRGSLGSGGL